MALSALRVQLPVQSQALGGWSVAAGGVCGRETDVERTKGETGGEVDVVVAGEVDVVVAGEVDTEKSG